MCALFGAEEHRYRLGRPLSVPDLDYIEGQLGVRLPEEYRLFLARVGHGGAGPYYGLFTLDGEDPEDITILEQARKDFRWSQAFNPADWEDPCNQEDVWCDEVDEDGDEEAGEPMPFLVVPGALYICHCGCAIRCFLIVRGQCAGEVWLDRQAEEEGLEPARGADGRRLGFLDWYEKWLDEGLGQLGAGARP